MARGLSTSSGLFLSHLPGKDLSAVTGVGSRAKIFFRPCVSSSSWVTLYTKVCRSSEHISSHGCDLKCFRNDAQKSVPYTEVTLALAAKEASGNKKLSSIHRFPISVAPRLDHRDKLFPVPPADRQSCAPGPAFTNMSAVVSAVSSSIYFRVWEGVPTSGIAQLSHGGCLGSLLQISQHWAGHSTKQQIYL